MNENTNSEILLGIDAGSTRIKGALWTGESWQVLAAESTVSYETDIITLISKITKKTGSTPERIIATGYGRKMVPGASQVVNEIGCHAAAAAYMVPGTRTVIDIGGQDAKIISITDAGKIADFVMNDKCAAGTGRFLSVLADRLGISLSEMGPTGFEVSPLRLSSMCTVFAESEVIGLLSKGYQVPEIIAGIHDAVARRTVSLASRLTMEPVITFLGGVSANRDIVARTSELIALPISVPDHAEYSGAIGAVLSGIAPKPWSLVSVQTVNLI